jgi:hypothetical protein
VKGLEEQADKDKAIDLFWKPLSWLWTIRPTWPLSVNEDFDLALCDTCFTSTLGLGVPVLSSLLRSNNSPCAKCGCKKHANFHRDHTSTCTAHSGATKAHDWMVGALAPLFRTAGHTVHTQQSRPSQANGAAKWRFGNTCETRLAVEPGLRPQYHARYGSSSHPMQNGHLTHPQGIDVSLHIAAQCKTNSYRQQYAGNQNISFLPAIVSTSTRSARRIFASSFSTGPRETEAQRNKSDSFRYKRASFYQGLKGKVGLAVAKAAALRINLSTEGLVYSHPQCTLPLALPSFSPSFFHTIPLSAAFTSA